LGGEERIDFEDEDEEEEEGDYERQVATNKDYIDTF